MMSCLIAFRQNKPHGQAALRLRISIVLCICLGAFASKLSAQPSVQPKFSIGLATDLTNRGTYIGIQATRSLTPSLELIAQAAYSSVDYSQIKCLATGLDTLLLLPGSQFYVGDDHREANLIVKERGEVTAGFLLSSAGRVGISSTLRVGLRQHAVNSQIDESITPEARRRQTVAGCGNFQVGNQRPSGPQELAQPSVFESNSITGLVVLGLGFEIRLDNAIRFTLHAQSRQYIYGGAEFRVRDTRQPGRGSEVLELRDHAPANELRFQAGLLLPLTRR